MNGVIIFWGIVLLIVGLLLGMAIGSRLNRRSKASPPASVPPVEISGSKPVIPSGPEFLRAGRTPAGKVWLEMDGVHLEDGSALQADQQRKLLDLVLELRPWLESYRSSQPTAPAARPAAAPAAPAPEKKQAPPPPAPLKTIIEQINDVLQAKLASTIYKERGVQLLDGPAGAIIVQDGLKKYDGIDSVPDPEIKALIRQAITDWEKPAK